MKNRIKIKVIKQGEAKAAEAPEINDNQPEEDNAANLSSTVSGWIDEFQTRRRAEKDSALKQFRS
jgi:hypothetical protein